MLVYIVTEIRMSKNSKPDVLNLAFSTFDKALDYVKKEEDIAIHFKSLEIEFETCEEHEKWTNAVRVKEVISRFDAIEKDKWYYSELEFNDSNISFLIKPDKVDKMVTEE